MMNIRKLLGSNIRAYRKSSGISQEKLAETVDMATNYLGLIEAGKKFPSAGMIERIAAALGKESAALFVSTSGQNEWKEHILLKMGDLIDRELAALTNAEAEDKRGGS